MAPLDNLGGTTGVEEVRTTGADEVSDDTNSSGEEAISNGMNARP